MTTYESRNLALCTKDCLCLFVCPTGATDTPTGQINRNRCLDGCRFCVDACPSSAIYLVYSDYPEPAPKSPEVVESLLDLCREKTGEEALAEKIADDTGQPSGARLLAKALRKSSRILAEDCAREAGYMLPRCRASRKLLDSLEG